MIKQDNTFQKRIVVKGGIISNRRLLSSLNYFSIFFAPFVFPLITIFVGETDIKIHGKQAFLSHCIPVALYAVLMTLFYLSAYISGAAEPNSIFVVTGVVFLMTISLSVIVWNIIRGIKVLKNTLQIKERSTHDN